MQTNLPTDHSPSLLLSGFMLLSIAATGIVRFTYPQTSDAMQYMSVWIAILAIIYFFWRNFSFSTHLGYGRNVFELPFFVSIIALLEDGLPGIFNYTNPDNIFIPSGSVDDILPGLILMGIGLTSMWIGYALIVSIWINTSDHQIDKPDYTNKNQFDANIQLSLKWSLVLYIILVGLRVVLIMSGFLVFEGNTVGYFQQILEYITSIPLLLIVLFTFWYHNSTIDGRWLFVFVAVEVIFSLIAGWSGAAAKRALLVIGVLFFVRGTIPFRFIPIGLVFFLIIAPIVREARIDEQEATSEEEQQIALTVENVPSLIEEGFETYESRQSGLIQSYSVVIKRSPEPVPYRDVNLLIESPLNVLPRFIYTWKPATGNIGNELGIQYFDLPETSTTSWRTPTPAVGFMYGGYPAAIILMLSVGIFFGILSRVLLVPSLINSRIDLLSIYIALSFLFPSNPEQFVQFTIQQLAVFLAVVWFLSIPIALGFSKNNPILGIAQKDLS